MNVLNKIIDWLADRPNWQSEALRRLVDHGDLATNDIDDLAEMCKKDWGLSSADVEARPPTKGQRTGAAEIGAPVRLRRIEHVGYANALAPGQAIDFAPEGLTIVYGNNASGKSGYARILKHACRARGALDEILTNVFADGRPGKPTALVEYVVGDKIQTLTWTADADASDDLGYVSVFDSKSAQFYVSNKADVAFTPFGLDLFDKLATALTEVGKILGREKRTLESNPVSLPAPLSTTVAGKMIEGLTAMTEQREVEQVGTLSPKDEERRTELRSALDRTKSDNPTTRVTQLRLRANQVASLARHCDTVAMAVAPRKLTQLMELSEAATKTAKVAVEARHILEDEPVVGTGSQLWQEMWSAAETFSRDRAYPDEAFPHLGDGAHCLLCQQPITTDAAARLIRLQDFLSSTLERDARDAKAALDRALDTIKTLRIYAGDHSGTIDSLGSDQPRLAKAVGDLLDAAADVQKAVLAAPESASLLTVGSPSAALDSFAERLREEAGQLEAAAEPAAREQLEQELAELDARAQVRDHLSRVFEEIERKRKINAYESAIKESNTRTLTRKSTELTTSLVTDTLQKAFRDEILALGFALEVELTQAGGGRGSLFHQLRFKRAPQVNLPTVVSEGEARCLAVAAFMAELATASYKSAILFDDPVSSLDHEWRDRVANRLAVEAEDRQVIVFSHDIVFLTALLEHADRVGVPARTCYLRREYDGAGICSDSLPWPAMNVKERIGRLRGELQAAGRTFRKGARSDYERHARETYGLLREAWERAVEEVLLDNVIGRFKKEIQTKRARRLTDITQEDYDQLDAGMTKCSAWIRGHDQAPAMNTPVPEPDELKADIDALDAWTKKIRDRRS